MISQRPLPQITPLTQPFWDAARAHELVVQRCDDCGALRFPPEVGCYACSSLRSCWLRMSGRAALYTWTVTYPPLLPYFAERAPWPVAVVQLEEGPRMVTNVLDLAPEEYEIGSPLEAAFEEVDDQVTLVVFRPARRSR